MYTNILFLSYTETCFYYKKIFAGGKIPARFFMKAATPSAERCGSVSHSSPPPHHVLSTYEEEEGGGQREAGGGRMDDRGGGGRGRRRGRREE